MKVAIMGAGLSGLACAITLEKHGITPTIFERRSEVGDRFVNGEAFMSVLNRPINDEYAYLSEKFGIFLQPLGNIKSMTFWSEKSKAVLTGNLGFLNSRGRHPDALEKQLEKQLKTGIRFEADVSYEQLLKDYTHVIMATGDAAYATKVQDYRVDLTVTLKGATVEGEFDRHSAGAWLDYDLAPQGYGYLLPFSEKEASITIGFPDTRRDTAGGVDVLWDRFYKRARKDLGQDLKITDNFQVTRYIIGQCDSPRIGNTFFTGNCLCAIMPAFGFGQLPAILSGIYAAYDLVGRGEYAKLVKPLLKGYRNSLVIRRFMEQMDNPKLDHLIASFDTGLANTLVTSEGIDTFKVASYLLRPEVAAYTGIRGLLGDRRKSKGDAAGE